MREPFADLIQCLSLLQEPGCSRLAVPGFYEGVRELSDLEREIFQNVKDFDVDQYLESLGVPVDHDKPMEEKLLEVLCKRWCEPSLTIHEIMTGTCTAGHNSLMPHRVTANFSVRVVPDQEPKKAFAQIKQHLEDSFAKMNSLCTMNVEMHNYGDWWLGNVQHPIFSVAKEAIEQVWGDRPNFIREGGSIPLTSWLERVLGAPALHLPIGQATDNAHMPNERLSLQNLSQGKAVIKTILEKVARWSTRPPDQAPADTPSPQRTDAPEQGCPERQPGGGGTMPRAHLQNINEAPDNELNSDGAFHIPHFDDFDDDDDLVITRKTSLDIEKSWTRNSFS